MFLRRLAECLRARSSQSCDIRILLPDLLECRQTCGSAASPCVTRRVLIAARLRKSTGKWDLVRRLLLRFGNKLLNHLLDHALDLADIF